MGKDRLGWLDVSNDSATIIKAVVALVLMAIAVIFSVSFAGKEVRDAYNQVYVVPVEGGQVWRQ